MLYLRIALAVFTLATISKAQEFASKAEEYLNAQFKRGHFMGSVLVARDGKILFEKGYGLANAEWNIPNTPQTKFRLGSITKQFTATANSSGQIVIGFSQGGADNPEVNGIEVLH